MSDSFDIISLLLVIAAVGNTFLGFLIYIKNRKDSINRVYAVNIIFIVLWTIEMYFYRTSTELLLLWTLFLYTAPTVIASTFLYFSQFFPTQAARGSLATKALIFIPNLLLVVLLWTPGAIIESVTIRPGMEKAIIFGPWYWLYALYFIIYFSGGMTRLFLKMCRSNSVLERRQIQYLLIGYSIAANLAMVTNLILPWFGNFTFNWIGQIFTMFMVIPVTYAVIKYQLFNLRVIATEMLVGSILIILLIEAFFSASLTEILLRLTLFFLVLVFGLLLIRSVLREVRQREQLQKLTTELEGANQELKKLDQAKSEFVSIASHQLRAPLTVIKGYVSLALEGTLGQIGGQVRDSLLKVSISANQLVKLVSDLLNLSRIESGKIQYEFKPVDFPLLVEKIVRDFKINAEKKAIRLAFEKTADSLPALNADPDKLREVVINLIDNAIKYSPQNGSVAISIGNSKTSSGILFSVKDSGIGIGKEDAARIFTKFTRTEEARKADPNGMGIGLYFVKRVVEDHKGRVWFESEGAGKGSTFFVELPLNKESPNSNF